MMLRNGRTTAPLWGMLLLAATYAILIAKLGSLSHNPLIDGTIGIALGLFICSRPASAAVDLLYMDRLERQQLASEWADLAWVGLNLLVMAAGSVVTIVGATRFVGQ